MRYLVSRSDMHQFIESCMKAVGAKCSHAKALADVLVEGDYRGHYSHGLNRLELYVKDLKAGICAKGGEPIIEKSTVATALVNGSNLLGPVVGNFCMDLAIQKAKEVGIGWVAAYGSNHYGIAGFYSMQALKCGLIGMSCTNTSPLVVPTRAKECTLGTNPLSVAAPALNDDSFVLDMATSAVALGKIEVQQRSKEKVPVGWGCDSSGKETTDPTQILTGGGLVPLGGSEATSGYKGYGLSLLVEVFCGMLTGSNYSKNIRRWKDTEKVANLGQCFVAINPGCFAPGFETRMSDLLKMHRTLEPSEPSLPVLIPGDPEALHMAECDRYDAIPYHVNVVDHMNSVAKELGVNLLPTDRTIHP
ncbi:putative oxidoreductase YjmC [Mustelus asterias]